MSGVGNPGPEFAKLSIDRKLVYLHHDLVPRAPALLARLGQLRGGEAEGAGKRASGFRVSVEGGPDLFVRCSRRGGMMRFLLDDLYLGIFPRQVHELALTAEARRRGAPVVEPAGAVVERVGPGIYRGMILTRAMAGMTLWEFARTDDDPRVREHVMRLARRSIDAMHEAGLYHADLNLDNLFVTTRGDELAVVILDLDKARLMREPVSPGMRRRNLKRLLRSIQKLDTEGRYFDDAARAVLTAA